MFSSNIDKVAPTVLSADLHSHLVYGVDDGPSSLLESRRAIEVLIRAGVKHVLTTPHVQASCLARSAGFARNHQVVEERWKEAVEGLSPDHSGVRFYLGREIMMDAFSVKLFDERVRLAGSRYALVEFPVQVVPPRSTEALARLRDQGVIPIVAHVERYRLTATRSTVFGDWRRAGAVFQVNAGSFLGTYGKGAQKRAFTLLSRGWVELVASDYHGRGSVPLEKARRKIGRAAGRMQEHLLFETNPSRVIEDKELEPVPAVPNLKTGQSAWLRRLGL